MVVKKHITVVKKHALTCVQIYSDKESPLTFGVVALSASWRSARL